MAISHHNNRCLSDAKSGLYCQPMAWTVSVELLGQSAEAVLARENNEV